MIKNLNLNEEKLRDLYLRDLSLGKVQGPPTGYASVDKPWLKYYKESSILTDIPDDINMYQLIKERNKEKLENIAISYYGSNITYQELFENIDKVASKYLSLGVKKGDIVSICMPSTPETVYSIYALNKIGAVCDMIDPRSNPKQLSYYLEENQSKIIMLCENYYKNLSPSLKNMDKVIITPISKTGNLKFKAVVGMKTKIDNLTTKYEKNTITYQEFLNLPAHQLLEEKTNIQDNALIIHSSGTTSTPKGIILTNKNVNALSIQYLLTPLDLKEEYRFLSVIPAFASFGVVASIHLPFYLCMENHLVSLVTPEAFYRKLIKEKINFTLTIPSNFKYIAKKKKIGDLSNLYGPGAGGYSVTSTEDKEINSALKKGGCSSNMLMGWGMSELSSTACLEFKECSKELSSGVPLVKNTIAIFKPTTDIELSYGEEGEICVTGPTVMKEYLNNSAKTESVIKKHSDGRKWLHSGDLGYMDLDGRVYPIDRLERMIIKGIDGFKIFPKQLEEVICTSPYVDSCVVVGYQDREKGVIPKAYIVPKTQEESEQKILEDVKARCIQSLSIRAIPEAFEIIETLPYTKMGKIDYKSLENSNQEKNIKKLEKKI